MPPSCTLISYLLWQLLVMVLDDGVPQLTQQHRPNDAPLLLPLIPDLDMVLLVPTIWFLDPVPAVVKGQLAGGGCDLPTCQCGSNVT